MRKLTMLSIIIMIGLSGLFTSCNLLFWDEPTDWLDVYYVNNTNADISLVFSADTAKVEQDSIVIASSARYFVKRVAEEDELIFNLQELVAKFSGDSISLYKSELFVKTWDTIPGSYGDTVHNFFNYDSWKLSPINGDDPNLVGEIIFTITDEDLK